ncbi:MAG: PqqD family protein [Candidatus Omnitrophota bacterium]|nr:PqqD family protein [Candidatus Omnitrophota bacterium]
MHTLKRRKNQISKIPSKAELHKVYIHSEGAITRDLEGEFIIVPLFAGMSDAGEDIFSLNEFGKAVWLEFDGKKALQEVIHSLIARYNAPEQVIRRDVLGFTKVLLKKKFLVVAHRRKAPAKG